MKGYEIFTKEKMLYLYKATKPIKYKKLQDRIYFELSNHIDDMFCDYIDEGMSEENATEKFLNEMGNPDDLGEELKKAHSKTLLFAKFQKTAILIVFFALIISAFGYFESKDNLKLATQYELPEETVELEKSLITYTKLEYWSFPIDIYFYTDINWHDIGTSKPLYKVKDYNLFNDYYVLDESQSVIVDLGYATHGDGTIYIDDISKLPRDYYSDKWSEVVFYFYDNDKKATVEICPDLTADEVSELSKFSVIPAYPDTLETEELIKGGWGIQFNIKNLEGMYFCSNKSSLSKSIDGKYYISSWDGEPFAEVPENIAIKIDKAFKNAGITFEGEPS